ncbi:TlpA family protein disulfide reductase [Actinomadura algeriensis]|uniref:Thiol-disulfide isomerase/thioredoxin n=1 Tax=Actinomadura algeriensis TaxID=1679523 RepID=A0ABR9JMA4_9ACTN|nr:TlpA disulfide reductase family protein [Actinomadura algeriensis]MBE1531680.1 thiol-disulfide isomerase/thioredoxin [Actinomadura algeriensis]
MSPRVFRSRAVVAVVALCGLLAGCAGTDASQDGAGGNRFVSGDGNVTEFEPADRESLGKVTGEFLDGKPFALSEYRGKVVVVNFWASWCAPCRGEAPSLEQVYKENEAKGAAFVGINFKDSKPNAEAFERNFEVSYPSVFDADGRVTLAFREVPPNAIPSTLVVDRQGRVAARIIGATTYSTLNPLVADVLAEK